MNANIDNVKQTVELGIQAMEVIGDLADKANETFGPDPPDPGQEPTFAQKHCKTIITCVVTVGVVVIVTSIPSLFKLSTVV